MRVVFVLLTALAVLASAGRAEEVDLELLLLVDVSRSMSPAELEIQRRGYAEALKSDAVATALGRTMTGRIALAYVEWAGEQATCPACGEYGRLRLLATRPHALAGDRDSDLAAEIPLLHVACRACGNEWDIDATR